MRDCDDLATVSQEEQLPDEAFSQAVPEEERCFVSAFLMAGGIPCKENKPSEQHADSDDNRAHRA